jgi:hypothetical protein
VACGAKGDQIFFSIVTRLASEFLVVDLEVRHDSAGLASPAITAQHLLPQFFVRFCFESYASLLRANSIHEAFSFAWCRNACFSCCGRNLNNCRIDWTTAPGLPFSRLAPARKSAQIISRQ